MKQPVDASTGIEVDMVPAWVVYIDTRDAKDQVVQIIDSIFYSVKSAKRRCNRINTRVEDYPNQVAWIEVEDRALGGQSAWYLRHHTAKLTRDNVREIRARWAAGEKVRVLTAEFSVTKSTIYDIVNGVSWVE